MLTFLNTGPECTLRTSDSEGFSARDERGDATGQGPEDGRPAKSYFYASPSETHHRMQLSCARLGLDPASGAFADCVAGLQASLFAADNPMN